MADPVKPAEAKLPEKAAAPVPAPAPTNESLLTAVLQKLTDMLPSLGLPAGTLREIMVEAQTEAAKATQKILRPENVEHPHISAFSYPEGDIARPKPKLLRETFFCGNREDEDRLTPAEIEAYNAITKPCEARGGAWTAEIRRSRNQGGKDTLFVNVPATSVDQRMMLPHQLTLILHELNGGSNTSDVSALLSEIERLKQELQASKTGGTIKSAPAGSKTASQLEEALLASS